MADAVIDHMTRNGNDRVAFIGLNDSYGDDWLSLLLKRKEIRVINVERYSRTDPSVLWQVLCTIEANPKAILIASSGTPAAIPGTGAKRPRLSWDYISDTRRSEFRLPTGHQGF